MKNPLSTDTPIELTSDQIHPKQRQSIASDINISMIATNLFIYKNPKELPEDSNFHIITYFLFQFGGDVIMKIIFAIFLLTMCIREKISLTSLAALLTSFQIWKISINVFYLFYYNNRVPEFKKTYYFEIILSTGYFTVFLALFLYAEGVISAQSLPLFVIPHIVLMLARLTVGEAVRTPYLPLSVFCFFESLQILYITLKVSHADEYPRWTIVLLFYYLVIIIMLICAVLLFLASLALGFILMFKRDLLEPVENLFLVFVGGIIFFFIWTGLSYYLLLVGFHEYIEPNGSPVSGITTNPYGNLSYASIIIITGGMVTLAILVVFFIHIRQNWVRFFNNSQPKRISLFWFTEGLRHGFTRASDEQINKDFHGNIVKPEGKCLICYDKDANVVIYPCGHSRICKRCITDYMKESDKCPICNGLIEKAFLVYYDEEKKDYLAKGFLVAK